MRLRKALLGLILCAIPGLSALQGPMALAAEPAAPPSANANPANLSSDSLRLPADASPATIPTPQALQDCYFTHLNISDALSDPRILSAVQDRQGFMWFGTEKGGLNRFDGYEIKAYQHEAKEARSLGQNTVMALLVDHTGTLWVATSGGGLNRYDPETDDFTQFRAKPGDEPSLPSDFVRALAEDSSGAIWVGTEGGLSRLDRATGKFHTFRHDPNNPRSLSKGSVDSLFWDAQTGQLWVGMTHQGLCVLAKGSTDFTSYRQDPSVRGSLCGKRALSFCKDRAGTLWIGTDGGLNRFVPESGSFVHYQNDPKDPHSLSDNFVVGTYEDSRRRFWVTTVKGVNVMDRARGSFQMVPYGADDSRHLLTHYISSLWEDNTGAIWFAEYQQGVSRLDCGPPRFTSYRKEIPGQEPGLGNEQVSSIFVDRNDRVWVGLPSGLDIMEGGRPPIRHFQFPENLAPSVQSITEDNEGGYWIGTFLNGLFHLQGEKITRLTANPNNPNDLSRPASDRILCVLPDPRHGVWIVYWYESVDYFDGKTFVRYLPDSTNPQRQPSGAILSVSLGSGGRIWMAGPAGLSRLDPSKGVFTTFQIDPEHPGNEINRSMATVFADPQSPGEVWVGTSVGLYQFDPASGRFARHYSKQDGLCADGVQTIERDNQGRFWLGTLNGLSRFDLARGTFRNYDTADGLPGRKFLSDASAKTSDGRLFFGTTKGLVTFDPSRMSENPFPPPVVLTGFELFNKPVGVGEKNSPLREAIGAAEHITLTHRQSVFTFKFAALNFTAPEKNRYAFKMEGFDEEWRYTDASRRFATYTHLPPGDYVFRVKAANNDGIWNEQGVSIRVTVLPPWWLTWWFRAAAFTALLALAIAAYRWRIKNINALNVKLEKQVAARTEELLTKSNELSQSQATLMETVHDLDEHRLALEAANQELEAFSYSVSHDLRAPLRAIDGFSRLLLEREASRLDDSGKLNLNRICEASDRMKHLIEDMLQLSLVTRSELRMAPVNLSDLAAEISEELRRQEPGRRVEFVIEPALTATADPNLLRIVLDNLLGNAWKFTGKQPAAKVEFGARLRDGGDPVFFVRDNGAGFDMAYAHKLFNTFERLHSVSEFPGTGIGLATVRRILQRHGGKIQAESAPGQGATFSFTIPQQP